MPSAKIEVEGISSLARTLRKVGDEDARDFLIEANKEAARTVEDTARPLVPIRKGKLVASLKSGGSAKGGVVQVGKKLVPWAGPIHFGWLKHNIKPNPFLYEALDKRRGDVEEIYYKRLDELLAKVKGDE